MKVGFADAHGMSRPELGDYKGILPRNPVMEHARAGRGQHALHIENVLRCVGYSGEGRTVEIRRDQFRCLYARRVDGRDMALTGDPISAEEAETHGLVSRLAKPGTAVDVAVELAERIARNAPLAVAASKRIVRAAPGSSEAELFALQSEMYTKVFRSNDAKEGPAAFAEKRDPNWSGT